MTRAIVYSVLLVLIVLTAYVYIERQKSPPVVKEAREQLPAAPSSSPPPPPPSALPPPASLPDAPPFPELNPADPAKVAVSGEDIESVKAAVRKVNEGDCAGAAALFGKVASIEKVSLSGLGLCYFKTGDYQKAISYLTRAVEYNGNDFISLKLLAFSYYRTDELEKSLRSAEAALALKRDPDVESLLTKLKKETRVQDDYNKESSSHFTIYYDGYAHGGIDRQVISILEDAYRSVGKGLDYYPPEAVTVILYGNKDFFDITRTPSWTSGYYDGKIRIPVKGLENQSGQLRRVLYHEYAHAVIRSITKSCPLWINEGLAEYFSAGDQGKTGQVIPLRALETSFAGLGAASARTAYQESYSAVSSLIDTYGMYRMKDLLVALSRGEAPNKAFEDSFGITYDEFVRTWK